MRKLVLGLFVVLLAVACGNKAELDKDVEQKIIAYEDSLANMVRNPLTHQQSEDFIDKYIDVLEKAVKKAPKNVNAPTYMDRLHMLASAKRDLKKSLEYGERIIKDYPDYPNRPMVLKSLAYTYDAEVQPRDTAKVRKYYTIYLEENSGIDVDEKDMIDKRLLMLHVPFDNFLILEQSLTEK